MHVGLIGCGAMGRKRAQALGADRLVACTDVNPAAAVALADATGAVAMDLPALLACRLDAVIVATPHDALQPMALLALDAGAHVFVEKPGAMSVAELDILAAVAGDRIVHVGFNHRYHPAIQKARDLVNHGELGPLMFVRGRYGHGGRLGYDREWRADPARGGGELLDQGVHLIDLARWFLGEFTEVHGLTTTAYWDMPAEDNAFLTLRTAQGKVAFLHASCTEWKNLFSLEIYGRDGKIAMDGLGGSYGLERCAWYQQRPEMGPPDTTIWEYPHADTSWAREWAAFQDDIVKGQAGVGLRDARAVLSVVAEVPVCVSA